MQSGAPPTPSVMSVFLKRESRVHITGGKSLRLQSLCSPLVKDAAIDLNHSAVIHDSGQKQLCSALMYGSYRLMMLSVTLLIHSCAFNKDVTCCESQLSSDAAECSWITSESK